MSEVDSTSGAPNQAGGENQDKVAYESYKKLLDEKKKLAQKLQEFEVREQEKEAALLSEQGKYKELLDKTQKDLASEREARKAERAKFGNSILSQELKGLAKGMGAKDEALDALVTLAYQSGLQDVPAIADDFSVNKESLKTFLGEFQTKNSFLFSKEVTPPKQITPGGGASNGLDVTKLKHDDLKKLLAEKLAKK